MIFYISVLISVFVLSIIGEYVSNYNKIRKTKVVVFFPILIVILLTLIGGFRFDTGMDFQNYTDSYIATAGYKDFKFPLLEGGYRFLVYLLTRLSPNPQLLFFVTSALINTLFIRAIWKYFPSFSLGILIYLSFFFLPSLNVLRQSIALGILLQGIAFLIRRDFYKFLLVVILASLFHVTSLLFLLFYPLFLLPRKVTLYFGVVLIAVCVLFISDILSYGVTTLLEYSDRYTAYTNSTSSSTNYMRMFWPIMIVISSLLSWKVWWHKDLMWKAFFLIVFGAVLTFVIISIDAYLVRLAMYFNLFYLFFIPWLYRQTKQVYKPYLYLFYVLLFCSNYIVNIKHNDNGILPYHNSLLQIDVNID